MTDTMGPMHSDAQFAGSSSVPAHVEMMGFLGIGNNYMGILVLCCRRSSGFWLSNYPDKQIIYEEAFFSEGSSFI